MSHVTGTVQPVNPFLQIGPASGAPPDAGTTNTWTVNFAYTPAPGNDTKLIILHFINANIAAGDRLEVELGYDKDVFKNTDGTNFWTRPIDVKKFAPNTVTIRFISASNSGSVTLNKYGRGERHTKAPDTLHQSPLFDSFSNCDPFFTTDPYVTPDFAQLWICGASENWEDVAKITPDNDIRKVVARSVGMIVSLYTINNVEFLSTCSVTLIGPDTIIFAGHCVTDIMEETKSASVIFNYQLEADGSVPNPYQGRFHKVREHLLHKNIGELDYCTMRLDVPPGGLGIAPIQVRHDLPGPNEDVFGIHHPNGTAKKLSRPQAQGFQKISSNATPGIKVNLDVAGGSSGSGLFDAAGRIVGILSSGTACNLGYSPLSKILNDMAEPPAMPAITRDVMIVFDRSGSMSQMGALGRTKIEEARDAASLFVQLVLEGTGNRVGVTSFSTAATKMPTDHPIAAVNAANKTALVGNAPFAGGKVGALVPGGNTSIGDGLKTAAAEIAMAGPNPRSILLFTDGLQNTPPAIEDASVQAALAGIDVHAIGYGTEASLNGDVLTALAQGHNGIFVRADTNLELEKFFSNAFGNIFESGLMLDPEFFLAEGHRRAPPVPFSVCGEDRITIVVGWEKPGPALLIELRSPGGAIILGGVPGIEQSIGRTWTFLRCPLPQGGERDGVWTATVFRPSGTLTAVSPAPATRYFINVIATGGPKLRRMPDTKRYYTGDTINPLSFLRYSDGSAPHNAKARLTVKRPAQSAGRILTQSTLKGPIVIDGDTIPARHATLIGLEKAAGKPLIGFSELSFDLASDPMSTNGAFKAPGIFGHVLKDLLTVEGNYTFHVVASYGVGCVSTRELQWSIYVAPGIDPARTDVTVRPSEPSHNGNNGILVLTPRDRYGNELGPGRTGDLAVTGSAGTTVTGAVHDNGDGTYAVAVSWNPKQGEPTVSIGQPGRPDVVVTPSKSPTPREPEKPERSCVLCWLLFCALLLVLLVLFLLWLCNKCW